MIGCRLAIAATVVLLVGGPVSARLILDDEPSVRAKNGPYYAEPGPDGKSTRVFRSAGSGNPGLAWEKPGWLPASFISDDGEYFVSGEYCESDLPRKYTMDLVIATFYRRSTPIASVRLRDVVVDPGRLKRVHKSGRMWGRCMDFLPRNRFAIDTWEYRRLVYDATTGKLIEVLPSKGIPNID